MAKINVFNFLTLNGIYSGVDGDISWHRHADQEKEFSDNSAEGGNGILLFGRVTYEMMASFWPTEQAIKMQPRTAKGMTAAQKIVFSKTLEKADWDNTTIVKGDLIEEVKKLKASADKDITILGSGSIVSQLAEAGLIDSYQIMIDPVAIGEGKTLFSGMKQKLDLKLTNNKVFDSGVILAEYVPL